MSNDVLCYSDRYLPSFEVIFWVIPDPNDIETEFIQDMQAIIFGLISNMPIAYSKVIMSF